eukprot:841826-Rhodomonas_salina.1
MSSASTLPARRSTALRLRPFKRPERAPASIRFCPRSCASTPSRCLNPRPAPDAIGQMQLRECGREHSSGSAVGERWMRCC